MIITALKQDQPRYAHLFDQMYRLRAAQFGVRRGWRVNVVDGRERDRFDDAEPLYVLNVAPNGQLLASLRLLQTTGPHMLTDVFPETLGGLQAIRDPLVFESTRFCADTSFGPVGQNGIHLATAELVAGLFELALDRQLAAIVSVYDLYLERVLRRVGCLFDRLGDPVLYDDLKTVAGVFEVSEASVASIRGKCGITWDVFAESGTTAAAS